MPQNNRKITAKFDFCGAWMTAAKILPQNPPLRGGIILRSDVFSASSFPTMECRRNDFCGIHQQQDS
jgi:hypothetical protein